MATKKTTKKTTKTTKKYDLSNYETTVDLTNATEPVDVYVAFAKTKITQTEFDALLDDMIENFGFKLYICDPKCCPSCSEKKPNIFKRFWNWLTK